MENAMPTLEVKSRRIGGATYQVPIEIPPERRQAMAMKWIITSARQKAGRSMADGLATELSDCFNNQGTTIKRKTTLTAWLKQTKLLPTTNGKGASEAQWQMNAPRKTS